MTSTPMTCSTDPAGSATQPTSTMGAPPGDATQAASSIGTVSEHGDMGSELSAPIPKRRFSSETPVGFVVVGLGMGHHRARTVAAAPGARLIGVCDRDPERARRTGEELQVPYTTELAPWLTRDEVEVVYIMTETGRHAEVAMQAFEAGRHVLSTKPMEATTTACEAMIQTAEERGLLLGVDFEMRLNPATLQLRAAVARKEFGRLLSGASTLKIQRTMDYFRSNGGWRGTRRLDGGGVFSNQTIHHIDELIYTLGCPVRVRCDLWTQAHAIEAEDLGTATWFYTDGLVVTLMATTSYPHNTWYHRLELEGETGAYSAVTGGPFAQPQSLWYREGVWSDQALEPAVPEWRSAAENFAAVLRSGVPLTCSGREGRLSRAVLDCMYRSAYETGGGWVEVH